MREKTFGFWSWPAKHGMIFPLPNLPLRFCLILHKLPLWRLSSHERDVQLVPVHSRQINPHNRFTCHTCSLTKKRVWLNIGKLVSRTWLTFESTTLTNLDVVVFFKSQIYQVLHVLTACNLNTVEAYIKINLREKDSFPRVGFSIHVETLYTMITLGSINVV